MRVHLQPPEWATHFLSDLTDWNRQPVPVAEMRPLDLPDDVYFEYAFQDSEGNKRPDPDNPNPILNPWWEFASNLSGPEYRADSLTRIADRSAAGTLLRMSLESEVLGENRRLLVYSPPGQANTPLPHVLFQDGKAYLGWGKMPQVMDAMLAAGRIGPAHLVFVPPSQRTREYAFNSAYHRFLLDEVLPLVESRVPCDGRRVAWGASLGGLLSAQLAWDRPGLFQKVVSQSGAFLFSEDMDLNNPFQGNESFLSRVRREDARDLAWHLDCGTLEWLLPSNRNLEKALAGKGMPVSLIERNAGHNWVNWRNGLAAGMEFALGLRA